MFKRTQGFIVGIVIGAMLTGSVVFATTGARTISVNYNNIKIVVDGEEIRPTDANGNIVEPFIYNGTTYLPVRAVANAIGKSVYWDGPNYTVYLGEMDGALEYPTLWLRQATNISGRSWHVAKTDELTDNYGNKYDSAVRFGGTLSSSYIQGTGFRALLDMQYSRFKGTAYVRSGTTSSHVSGFKIIADGNVIYSSDAIDKSSRPIYFDVDIRGCNDFQIQLDQANNYYLYFADAGFYQ